jgi:glycosyltransferase involved in cell wall biosynthesis
MMRAAHLTSVHDAGDTRIVHRECATLAQNGYEVVLVAAKSERAMPAGVRYHPVPAPRNRLERFTKTQWAVYRAALAEEADLYHFHDPELIPIGIALSAAGKSVIFDVHEDIPDDIATKPWIWAPLRPVVAAAAAVILRAVQRAFSGIVAATPAIARRYRHPHLTIVQNLPPVQEFPAYGSAPYDERPPAALYVGQITRLRGIEQMVEAMGRPDLPPDSRLILVGEFESRELRESVMRLPGWRRVTYHGYKQRSELSPLLAAARMGLLILLPAPNHSEAQPTKLLEYMAAALPVVASEALSRCREIVESTRCGLLVDPLDSNAIADAILHLLAHPREAREMGERGRLAVLERYNWSAEAPKLLQLYASAASKIP